MISIACDGRDDLFFPEDDNYDTVYTMIAKRYCSACPIFEQCQRQGLDDKERFGIWGGLTPDERREILNVGKDWE